MARSFLFVSSFNPEAARRAVLAPPLERDLAVISPSDAARETAGYAVGGRWVFTVEEPLLAAYDTRAPLVVLDGLDVLGASAFTLDEAGLMRSADDLERTLPLP